MFRRSAPNLDEVRGKLMRLVGDYAGGVGMTREQIFSKMEKLITRDVAEQFDGTVNKNADVACLKIVGEEYLSTLSPFDVATYLVLVVSVSEFVLRKQTTQLARLRVLAANSGVQYYDGQLTAFLDKKNYQSAEIMGNQMLVCVNLWKEPDEGRMIALYKLAYVQYQQGKQDKARQNAQAVVAEYDKLSSDDKSSTSAQSILNGAKQILSLLH